MKQLIKFSTMIVFSAMLFFTSCKQDPIDSYFDAVDTQVETLLKKHSDGTHVSMNEVLQMSADLQKKAIELGLSSNVLQDPSKLSNKQRERAIKTMEKINQLTKANY